MIWHVYVNRIFSNYFDAHLPRPFSEGTMVTTDDPGFWEQSPSAHCKNKHCRVKSHQSGHVRERTRCVCSTGWTGTVARMHRSHNSFVCP